MLVISKGTPFKGLFKAMPTATDSATWVRIEHAGSPERGKEGRPPLPSLESVFFVVVKEMRGMLENALMW